MRIKTSSLILLSMALLIAGCSDPKIEAIHNLCLGLEKIENKADRNAQYMQCRKACGDAEIYNMKDGEEKQDLMNICVRAGETGDSKFEKSAPRNWLGVMP